MPKTVRDVPPPLELLCLKALWSLREGSVRDVRTIVTQTRPLAYTTVMTVLERLVRKGKVVRRKAGRAFVYTPEATRDALRRVALKELLEAFFDGSEQELIRFLTEPAPQAAAAVAAAGAASAATVSQQPATEEQPDPVLV
jgi:predicted transcriptional regulator